MSLSHFSGRTAAEAAIKACDRLGLTRPELKYDIVQDEGEGLARQVTIEVKNAPRAAEAPPAAPAPLPFERSGSEAFDEDDEPPRRDEVANESRPVGGGRGGRGARNHRGPRAPRGQDERHDGGHRHARGKERGPRRAARQDDRAERPERNERSERRSPASAERRPRTPRSGPGLDALLTLREPIPEVQPLPAIAASSPRASQAIEVVQALVTHMALRVTPSLVREDEGELHVHMHGDDEKKAIGQRGEVLLALQFLANRLLGRAENEGEADQVLVLDAGGHRERRRVAIESLAKALAERALSEGKAVRLSPMSAHDRRIVHVALESMEGIVTQSEGDGMLRNLLIVPAALVG